MELTKTEVGMITDALYAMIGDLERDLQEKQDFTPWETTSINLDGASIKAYEALLEKVKLIQETYHV